MCHCADIPTKLQFCKFSFCEVPSGSFCNFSIWALFLLSFLAFFRVRFIWVSLFPFWFLSSFDIVTSRYWDSFLGFKGNTYFLSGIGISVFFGSSSVLATLISMLLLLNICDLFSCYSIKCVILLVIKSFNSFFFFSKTSYSSFLLDLSLSIQGLPSNMVNGTLSSINLIISKSSSVEVPLTFIGI